MYRRLAVLGVSLALLVMGSLALAQQPIKITVWFWTGQEAERAVIEAQVAEFNSMRGEIQVTLVNIPEAGYTDQVRAAGLAGKLPDVLGVDGPTMANFAWSGFLRPLDDFVTLSLYKDLLPSIIAQGTYPPDGKLYCIGTFDSGLALWGNREYLQRAGVRIPTSVADAWDKVEFEDALAKLAALPEVEWPLDLKLNYGPGEWFTYGFSPIIQSFGADLIDRNTWKAGGTLDSPEAVAAMQMMQSWVQKGWVVPESAGDDAFYGTKKAALAYVGHWMWPVHNANLGGNLVLIPTPKFGPRHVAAMGSWCWGISAITTEHIKAAWQFLEFLLIPAQIVRMINTNGAPPARLSASSLSLLHGPGKPLNLYIEQLAAGIAVPRPTHPAYPVITVAFKDAVKNILAGADAKAELTAAAAKIDQDIKDNDCYPPFRSSLCP